MRSMKPFLAILGILVIAGCGPVPSVSAPGAAVLAQRRQRCQPRLPLQRPFPPDGQRTTASCASTRSATRRRCRSLTRTRTASLINFPVADRDSGARNFIYVSVITPEIEAKVAAGDYLADVYNYDPAATDTLLSMQVGESGSSHQGMASGFTYQRLPDTTLGGAYRPGLRECPAVGVPARDEGDSLLRHRSMGAPT